MFFWLDHTHFDSCLMSVSVLKLLERIEDTRPAFTAESLDLVNKAVC